MGIARDCHYQAGGRNDFATFEKIHGFDMGIFTYL